MAKPSQGTSPNQAPRAARAPKAAPWSRVTKNSRGPATTGMPASQPATRGPCRRSTMPSASSARGTIVSFRISTCPPKAAFGGAFQGRECLGGAILVNAWPMPCHACGRRQNPQSFVDKNKKETPVTRIFIAGIFHETHSFTPDITGLDQFTIHRGPAILARRGDASQLDGFLSVAEREGWELVPSAIYTGGASGTVDHAVFEAFWSDVKPVLEKALAEGLDGIHLSLHGAMVTSECDDPEGELLGRIRAMKGAESLPIFGVGDLHATLTPRMGALCDGIVFYRECPHTDQFDSAVRSGELLARCLKTGVRPKHRVLVTPIVWPPTGTGTRDGPMRALEDAARRMEREVPGMLAVNVVGGYAFSDVPNAGVSFSVITEGSEESAREALHELAGIAWQMREGGIPEQHD